MLKITAIVSLLLIATWSHAESRRHKREATASKDSDPGSTLWAASLSCDSCGSECAAACGTRHFRSCCFNYLRRKRGPESIKFWSPNTHENLENTSKPRMPLFIVDTVPEQWMSNILLNDYKPYLMDDTVENRLQEFEV